MKDLGKRLLDRLGDRRGTLVAGSALDDAIADVVARGEARLEHHPVDRGALIDRIADAMLADDAPGDLAALARLHAADLYLACALATGDEKAVAVAEAELIPAARQSAGRIDGTRAFVDEVAQIVRDRLLVGEAGTGPAIRQYRGSGPLARWVRVVATRVALDLKRRDARVAEDGDGELERIPAPSDPELEYVWRTCADQYKAALADAFAALSQRDRNLMRQRYVDDLNIDALGRLHRVHPATAFRWLKKVEEQLATATRKALMERLAITESQVESMERMVASQLQISLTRMLRARPKKPSREV
jgi:RNA polymerase sigma-70 factor (ECF subfamily)